MLDKETVNEATKALYAYLARTAKGADKAKPGKKVVKALFEEASDILLVVSLKKTPAAGRTKPYTIPLKHSLYGQENQRVCVFTKDPQAEFEELVLERNPVDNVKQVVSVSKLRKEFHQYKDRRDLLASYDLFMADDRVLPLLPGLLGNKFFHKKKQPVPVNLKSSNLKRELESARDSTYMWISTGSTICVKVARSSMTRSQAVANIMTAMEGVAAKIPKKWANIQSVFIKTPDSVSLAVHSSLPDEEVVGAAAEEAKPAAAKKAPAKKAKKAKKAVASSSSDEDEAEPAAAAPAKKTKKAKRKAGGEAAAPAKKRTKKRAAA